MSTPMSVRVVPKTYRLTAPSSLDSAAIVIRGDGITVDFAGATLLGTAPGADPDQGAGVAIRIEGGRNITVRNATIRGYKIGILARDVRGLRLIGNDASHNWKPRLYSLIEHESLVYWLSYHQNDKDEWYRYGAAFYLSRVRALKQVPLSKAEADARTRRGKKGDYDIPEAFDIRRWSRQQIWDYDVHAPVAAAVRFRGSLAGIAKQLLPAARVETRQVERLDDGAV